MSTSLEQRRLEIETRLTQGEPLRSIAASIGTTYQSLQYHRRMWGAVPLRVGRTSGERHASWKGGSYIDSKGYKMIRAEGRKKASNYVYEHVVVAEAEIGRPLRHGEHVHHINGDKSDNSPDNLLVCTASEHRTLHRQLEELAMLLVQRNVIQYKDGRYQFA